MKAEQRSSTFLTDWTAWLVDSCLPDGEAQAALLASVGIVAGELRQRDGRLPYDGAIALWSQLTDNHTDPVFGLNFAERTPLAALGVLGYLAASSETLGAAFQRVVAFERLLKDPGQLELRADGEAVCISESPPPGRAIWPRQLSEAILMTYVALARRWTKQPVLPRRVSFQHAAPASTELHERRFGCRIEFAAPKNEVIFAVQVLDLPLCSADEPLASYLESVAAGQLDALPPADTLVADVRRTIVELLPEGPPTLERVARRLGIGARTLQRRLEERGLLYQAVVDEVRQASAQRLLARAELSVAQVAYLLGYSDPSGFQRAHRRWTGRAPRQAEGRR